MENQQTVVDWIEQKIVERIVRRNPHDTIVIQTQSETLIELFEQAKEMEKKQREKDFVEGYKTRALASNLIFDEKSEYFAKKLFNRTFKSE
jgi:hypothetical protein